MGVFTRLVVATCIPLGACRERVSQNHAPNDTSVLTHVASTDTAPPLPPQRARVNGIGVDQTSLQVRAILGAPDSVPAPLRFKAPGDSATVWLYPTTRIDFIGDRVRGVVCRGKPCQTPDGVSAGDSLSQVQRVYGPPVFALTPPGTRHRKLMYPTAGDCIMEFEFDSDVITKISLGCD